MIDQRIRQLRSISPYTGFMFVNEKENHTDINPDHWGLKPKFDAPMDSMALSNMRNCLKYMKEPTKFTDQKF